MPEVFRKQALRLEELERENRRLERELEDVGARWKKSEEKLEDLRDASGELVEVRDRLGRAEKRAEEVERLVSVLVLFLSIILFGFGGGKCLFLWTNILNCAESGNHSFATTKCAAA